MNLDMLLYVMVLANFIFRKKKSYRTRALVF